MGSFECTEYNFVKASFKAEEQPNGSNDDGCGVSFVRTLKNFSVLCTFGEELELESTVKKKSYLIFIDF